MICTKFHVFELKLNWINEVELPNVKLDKFWLRNEDIIDGIILKGNCDYEENNFIRWEVSKINPQLNLIHKQPPEVLYKKRCSEKFCNIHRKKSLLESLFIATLKACNFIKKRLQHKCFLVNMAKFLWNPVLKNICERLHFCLLPILYDFVPSE